MKKNLTWLTIGALLLLLQSPVGAADYEREKKWADEILPGLVVGDPVYLQTPRGHRKFLALYTPADTGKAAVVVHGMGIHPDWGMVGTLRTELADRGIATLSIQMPILAADAKSDAYPPTYPEAAERIAEAVEFLKAKGYRDVAVVSHSMGSRMSLAYFTGTPDPAVKAWASLGPSFPNYGGVKLPILDLYGENDLPPVLTNASKRKQSLADPASRQTALPRTDHFFTGHEGEMVSAVADFLNTTLK